MREERVNDEGELRGRCEDCGVVGVGVVQVHTPSGTAGWECPDCGSFQEPPEEADPEGWDSAFDALADAGGDDQ